MVNQAKNLYNNPIKQSSALRIIKNKSRQAKTQTADDYPAPRLVRSDINERLLRATSQKKEKEEDEKAEKTPELGQVADGYSSARIASQLRADKKKKKQRQIKKEKMAKKAQAMMSPARIGTSRALQWAWFALIPSWGLSLLYINLHVLMRWIFGEKFFCKLGEEWIPPQAKVASGGASKMATMMLGWAETFALLLLDILALIFIGAILALLITIISFITASLWDKIKMIWNSLGYITDVLKVLFKGISF